MIKFSFILFLFIFFNFNANSSCKGFCEGEEYLVAPPQIYKDKFKLENKNYKVWIFNRGLGVKNSNCLPFFNSIMFTRKNNSFKNEKKEIWYSTNEINTCAPCNDFYRKNGYTGFCPMDLYTLRILYEGGLKNDYPPKKYRDEAWWWYRGDKTIRGRDYSDVTELFMKHMDGIIAEELKFTVSPKKDLLITKIIDDDYGEVYIYEYLKYKTPFKEQIIEASEKGQIEDLDAQELVDIFIQKMLSSIGEFYFEGDKDKRMNTDILYKSIPSKEEIREFSEYFPELKTYHVQRRN